MPTTVRDVINRAFRVIHVLGAGESLTTDESSDALVVLNEIIEQTTIDKLLGYYKIEVTFPSVQSQSVYTIGPASSSPHVTSPRPVEILSAFSRRLSQDVPMQVLNKQDYDNINMKSLGIAGWFQGVYYEPTWPKGTMTFYMVPLDTLTEIHITASAEIPQFATLDDSVSLPPGYKPWMTYKLAERLSPEYGMEFTQKMQDILTEAESAVKRNNIKPMPIATTGLSRLSGDGGKYNVYGDYSGR